MKLIGVICSSVLIGIYQAFVIAQLWGWFAVPTFNLPELSVAVVMGLLCITTLLKDYTVSEEDQLRLEVLKFIIADKQAEKEAKELAAVTRTHNEKIDKLIAQKQDEELSGKSVEELMAMKK